MRLEFIPRESDVPPGEGGCRYCHVFDEHLVFCNEFDTAVHPACVRRAVADAPDDAEARIIAAEVL